MHIQSRIPTTTILNPSFFSQLLVSSIRQEGGQQVLADQCSEALVPSVEVLTANSNTSFSGSDTGKGTTSTISLF